MADLIDEKCLYRRIRKYEELRPDDLVRSTEYYNPSDYVDYSDISKLNWGYAKDVIPAWVGDILGDFMSFPSRLVLSYEGLRKVEGHKLTMISGVSRHNDQIIGIFKSRDYAEIIAKHILELDAK